MKCNCRVQRGLWRCRPSCGTVIVICIGSIIVLNLLLGFIQSSRWPLHTVNKGPSVAHKIVSVSQREEGQYHTTPKTGYLAIKEEDYRNGAKCGNPLIDNYGMNDLKFAGERGNGIVMPVNMKTEVAKIMEQYRVNILASDDIPLNRLVPDSRIEGCSQLTYNISSLPTATIIIPFYNEWPSLLLRTVYSVINRTPRQLVSDIILVDDASTLESLHESLDKYIEEHFPRGLVRLFRQTTRQGLIKARMRGYQESKGDVLVFFDSHMEVNIEWLEPLLTEISRDRTTVAMSTLDYIQPDTFEYRFNVNYLTRYVWTWTMTFFETFFRDDQVGSQKTSPRPGAAMVGAAFAMDKKYFAELGGYDEGMSVWGGENLEMSWRVWLCGGRMMHLPCSRIGHVARSQPYNFPGGRGNIENFNYKRAVDVWMGDYARFPYFQRPQMRNIDVGDLSKRLAIKKRLKCKDFSWYLKNVWPELNIYDENAVHWGLVKNEGNGQCLDNNGYLFQAVANLFVRPCAGYLDSQGFTLTTDSRLRTTLQCVVVAGQAIADTPVQLEDCIIGRKDKWEYTQDKLMRHMSSKLCMEAGSEVPVLRQCDPSVISQRWAFQSVQLPSPAT